LAYYKTKAEYKLLRLLELGDVHSCTPVALKRHDYTFGLVSPIRTYYLQAESQRDVTEWVKAIEEARQTLMATSTQNTVTTPIDIPKPGSSRLPPPVSPSPPSPRPYINATSSDSEEGGSPRADRATFASIQDHPPPGSSPSRVQGLITKDPSKIILSGYLLKCDSKRRNWRKRWFVLTGEKLIYSGSHMVSRLSITIPVPLLMAVTTGYQASSRIFT
jgi:pleckstrin homology domain-containing family A member 1/2